ncbi:hypothetical protein [Ancylobacter oerskovii]|uniref:Uncharacterized protein n=1 Tax=Ancylobacter oerskovii TaxID=459519 RepID=A0ABW4YWR3_9HYPH|nr:hypothetical protein [Ancylobacter oerskovii]MBS7544093.1 hypothetical protein [Ancylobacter oerskovii]
MTAIRINAGPCASDAQLEAEAAPRTRELFRSLPPYLPALGKRALWEGARGIRVDLSGDK